MNIGDFRLLVIEPKLRENFYPLTYTKLGVSLLSGTKTLFQGIEDNLNEKLSDIYVPEYLKDYAAETFPKLHVNEPIASSCIFVNAFISCRKEVWNFFQSALNDQSSTDRAYFDPNGDPVFGKLSEANSNILRLSESSRNSLHRKIEKRALPQELENISLIRYPWELVRDNPIKIVQDYSSEKFSSPPYFSRSGSNDMEVRGSKVVTADSAEIERFVTLDSTSGPIIIEEGAVVESFTRATGPCYIGKNAKIRSARIREGTTVGARSKVAGEVECSIISEFCNKSHEGFLGHSIAGSWVNFGAMTACSDLKNTYGTINVKSGRKSIDTREIKVGVFLGDMAKTAIGTLLTSGKRIGVSSQVFGLVSEDVPSFTMYGKALGAKSSEVILESALVTQKRMMERRGLIMTSAFESLIRSVYKMTKGERAFHRVSKSRFKLP